MYPHFLSNSIFGSALAISDDGKTLVGDYTLVQDLKENDL